MITDRERIVGSRSYTFSAVRIRIRCSGGSSSVFRANSPPALPRGPPVDQEHAPRYRAMVCTARVLSADASAECRSAAEARRAGTSENPDACRRTMDLHCACRREVFRARDQIRVLRQAEIVLLDLFGRSQKPRRETPGERGFAEPLESRKEHRLRIFAPARSCFRARSGMQIAPEILKHALP